MKFRLLVAQPAPEQKSMTTFALSLLLSAISMAGLINMAPADASEKIASTNVVCKNPYNAEGEEKNVIAVLEAITKCLAERDFQQMKTHMDEQCSTYDEKTKKLVKGSENIVQDVQAKIADEERRSKAPIISYTIDRPFARVAGDTATVSFYLVKELGGAQKQRFESHCTDVFVKRDGQWKKLHYYGGEWKLAKQ